MSALLLGIRVGIVEISTHKFRSGLSMLGIIIGVAAVIAAVSIGEGMRDSVISQLGEVGSADQVNVRGEPRWVKREGEWTRNDNPQQLNWADHESMAGDLAGGRVTAVLPEVSGAIAGRVGRISRGVTYLGVDSGGTSNRDWVPAAGRELVPLDDATEAMVCLLGSRVAADFFPAFSPARIVGEEFQLGPHRFMVVGVLEPRGQSLFQDQNDLVVLPASTAQRRLSRSEHLSRIVLELRDPSDAPEVERWIRTILASHHDGGENFRIDREEQIVDRIENVTLLINLTLGGIAGISLLVGGIGIMNIMLASVTERTREIGVRKAVGATNRDVLAQFLMESATITMLGGLGGAGVGVGLGLLLARAIGGLMQEQIYASFAPSVLVLSVAFSGAVGLFFGLAPARRAARLDPIESLRHE